MTTTPITDEISLDEKDLRESFVRASGPGGQNVNKVATAVQLRFDVQGSELPEAVKRRLIALAGRRIDSRGFLHIDAQGHRSRERNRQEARLRLRELVARATVPPIPRRKTRPSAGSRIRRLEAKRRTALKKGLRGGVPQDD